MPLMNMAIPTSSHGKGFKCWSHPLAVAVCQQVVSRPGALYPSDVEQENATPAEKAERRATDRRPRCHKRANDGDRRKSEYAKRHEAKRCGTSEKRPHPKPAASGDMSANQWSESRRIWPPSRLHSMGGVTDEGP